MSYLNIIKDISHFSIIYFLYHYIMFIFIAVSIQLSIINDYDLKNELFMHRLLVFDQYMIAIRTHRKSMI